MRWTPSIFLAFLLAPAPAGAEPLPCRLCSETDGGGLTDPAPAKAAPMALEVYTSLNFDRVILTGPAGGHARIAPDGSRQTRGALTALTGRAMTGEVLIRGEPGRQVRVDLPQRIELLGYTGGALSIKEITTDLPPTPKLDNDGRLRVRFGGELSITGDAEGEYEGDIPITVDYL